MARDFYSRRQGARRNLMVGLSCTGSYTANGSDPDFRMTSWERGRPARKRRPRWPRCCFGKVPGISHRGLEFVTE